MNENKNKERGYELERGEKNTLTGGKWRGVEKYGSRRTNE